MPLPGHPESEQERPASWLRLPRRARVAIGRFHRNLRHLLKEALVQMLRAARAPQDCINAAKTFRCQGCDNTKPRPQTHKVSPPRLCTFNHEVGVDVFEIVDSVGTRVSILNAVCMGTTYDQAWIVRESESLGSSVVTCMSTSIRAWLDALGRLASNLFAAIEGHTTEAYWDSCQEWCSDQTRRIGSTRTNRKSGTTRCHA